MFFFKQELHAQDSTWVESEPNVSTIDIALRYYSISWSEEQWKQLRGKSLELGYLIDDIGEPFLRSVRGTDDKAIIHSLIAETSKLPYFTPAIENGVPVESAYYINIPFPDLGQSQAKSGSSTIFFPSIIVDRELLESEKYVLTNMSAFLDLGLHINSYQGPISNYLKTGGGLDTYFGFHWKGKFGLGGMIGVEFNKKKQLFPIDPFPMREVDMGGGTYIGPIVDYYIIKTKKRELSLRGELGIGTTIVASKIDPPNEEGFIKYNGIHVGTHINYNIKLGKYGSTTSASDKVTTGIYHGLNIYSGVRLRHYTYSEARGLYLFLGVGYRLGMNNLKLNPDY